MTRQTKLKIIIAYFCESLFSKFMQFRNEKRKPKDIFGKIKAFKTLNCGNKGLYNIVIHGTMLCICLLEKLSTCKNIEIKPQRCYL